LITVPTTPDTPETVLQNRPANPPQLLLDVIEVLFLVFPDHGFIHKLSDLVDTGIIPAGFRPNLRENLDNETPLVAHTQVQYRRNQFFQRHSHPPFFSSYAFLAPHLPEVLSIKLKVIPPMDPWQAPKVKCLIIWRSLESWTIPANDYSVWKN
jgi:hypothetical protein